MVEEHAASCPYCGEIITLLIDTSVTEQRYVEDCEVCCRPMVITATVDMDGVFVTVQHEDE